MQTLLQLEIQNTLPVLQTLDLRNKWQYGNWLAQTYYFVRHSVRLLNLSAGLTPFDLQFFHQRANDHAHEERGHEKLALNDLKALGFSIEQFPELSATQALYQSQYYGIQNIHPLAFLGYVLFLETLPIVTGRELQFQLQELYGPKSVSFIKVHAQEDPAHVDKLVEILNQLSPELQKTIQENLKLSAYLYQNMIRQLAMDAGTQMHVA